MPVAADGWGVSSNKKQTLSAFEKKVGLVPKRQSILQVKGLQACLGRQG